MFFILHINKPYLRRKQGWIRLLSQLLVKEVGLNASSTSLISKTSDSKYYPAEKPPNEALSLESRDTFRT